jgi:hypothetical protein
MAININGVVERKFEPPQWEVIKIKIKFSTSKSRKKFFAVANVLIEITKLKKKQKLLKTNEKKTEIILN